MRLRVEVRKPENAANASRPLQRAAAVRANYARIAAKKRERNDGWMAARRALCSLPCNAAGRVDFRPLGYRIVWPYKGTCPDADNVVARMKHVLDGCALAFNLDDRDLDLLGVERVRVVKGGACDMDDQHAYVVYDDLRGGVGHEQE